MKPAIALLSVVLLLLNGPRALAQTESVVELEAPLSGVTVFPEGALCEHQVRLQLPAGRSRVTMVLEDELPTNDERGAIDRYRFASDGCTLLQSVVEHVTTPPTTDQIEDHQRALAEQTQRVRTAQGALDSARSDLELLDTMGRTMSEQVDASDQESISTLHSFLKERRHIATLHLNDQEHALATEEDALEQLTRQGTLLHQGTRRLQAKLLVDAEVAGPARLLATSFIEEAGWTPQLRIARSSTGENAQIALLADVTNGTTQDWDDITLVISTSRLREFEPLANVAVATIDVRSKDEPAAELDENPKQPTALHSLQASHTLTLPTTIERDQTKLLLLERFETQCVPRYHARPTVDGDCHILSTLRNETSQLISAAPVALFVDGRMTGRTMIENVPPGESFTVSWGIRPNLQIERSLLERTSTRTGLLGGGRRTNLRYRITIRNLEPEPLELILEDRLPSTLSDDIKVSALDFSQPIEASPLETDGRIRWRLAIPAGGTQSPPTTVEWTVEVTHSADLKTTPIPE